MRVFGIVGWSGSGKTTLLVELLPALRHRGYTVSTIKHAHHHFDIDQPGKDSWRHREAGAAEVLIASSHRWVLQHENRDEIEPTLNELLGHISPVNLVVIEGFKSNPIPKLEVIRPGLGTAYCYETDPTICAVASFATDHHRDYPVPFFSTSNIGGIMDLILDRAIPAGDVV